MSRTPINRARRNALKAGSLVLGAVLATGALHRPASAGPLVHLPRLALAAGLPVPLPLPRVALAAGLQVVPAAVALRGARRS